MKLNVGGATHMRDFIYRSIRRESGQSAAKMGWEYVSMRWLPRNLTSLISFNPDRFLAHIFRISHLTKYPLTWKQIPHPRRRHPTKYTPTISSYSTLNFGQSISLLVDTRFPVYYSQHRNFASSLANHVRFNSLGRPYKWSFLSLRRY